MLNSVINTIGTETLALVGDKPSRKRRRKSRKRMYKSFRKTVRRGRRKLRTYR